jgi:hypothetical protein
MLDQQESVSRIETLLGSLIKMVGRTNERVDQLDKRVHQMEWAIRETHMIAQETDGKLLYASYIQQKKQ